jgi:NADPH:quinone reductase-like Zn-dependent oxidoreductase
MKAIVYHNYGSPDVLRLEELEKPRPTDDEVLVRVRAASANPLDWHYMRGSPYIMRLGVGLQAPKITRLGVDLAGIVEAVGKNVTHFKPGDEVFGARNGAFAEYVVTKGRALVPKPANLTFEQAAAVPVAACTALQGLRDHGRLQPEMQVLVNGAAGGVGTFAVQIAKALGARVTGVTSTRNLELVRSLGADRVIDYTQEDFTQGEQRYDILFDLVGNHALGDIRRVLNLTGSYIIGGGPAGRWLGPVVLLLKARLWSRLVRQRTVFFLASTNNDDLGVLAELMETGKVTPVVDRTYPLSETAAAIRYLEDGHARGKVVITVGD